MKTLSLCLLILISFAGCDTNENNFRIHSVGAVEIVNVETTGNNVTVTVVYGTPTPCWYFERNETSNNDLIYTSKVFAKDDGEPCIQVIDSFSVKEKITFSTFGEKTLRFWQNDSMYLDTVITLE